MKNLLLLIFLPFLMNSQETKTSEIVNPSGKWFFGVETGPNFTTSVKSRAANKFIQNGLVIEYYYNNQVSISTKIKYFKTKLSNYLNAETTDPNIINQRNGYFAKFIKYGEFEGHVISFPVSLNFHTLVANKLIHFFSIGCSYNYEIKTNYYNINEEWLNYNEQYFGLQGGTGVNYYTSKRSAILLSVEFFVGTGYKGRDIRAFMLPSLTSNVFINMGYKFNL